MFEESHEARDNLFLAGLKTLGQFACDDAAHLGFENIDQVENLVCAALNPWGAIDLHEPRVVELSPRAGHEMLHLPLARVEVFVGVFAGDQRLL